jgi:hypothetical protein
MLIHQATDLHLADMHDCCLAAEQCLVPPHTAGKIEVAGLKVEFMTLPYWSIALWGGQALSITHCPFCGERLPLERDDCSGIDFDRIEGER